MKDNHGKEIHTEKITAESRTYYFDVKENRNGDRYLCITEKRSSGGEYNRHRVMVFEEHLDAFHDAYLKTVKILKL